MRWRAEQKSFRQRIDNVQFYLLPDHVCYQGPWQGMRRGDMVNLKPEYRLALAHDGYALVKCEGAMFKSEA
jgi:hypothetical protein